MVTQEMITFVSTWVHIRFWWDPCCPTFQISVLCFSVVLVLVLNLVYPMLPFSLYCPFLIVPSVFSSIYLSCVLCTQCCHCLRIVHSSLPLRFSLTFIPLVSCKPNVAIASVLFILDCLFVFL